MNGQSFRLNHSRARNKGSTTGSARRRQRSALVQLEEGAWSEPNARATMIELYEGLTARSRNCWLSVAFGFGSVSGAFAPLLAAGFYYKTFMWPRAWWKGVYEKLIRHAAGMGRAPALPDPDRYAGRFAHCDVLVASGGPAGLAASLAAVRAGVRVVIAEEQAELGGRLLCEPGEIDGRPALDWVAGARAELAAMPEVTVLARSTVCGVSRLSPTTSTGPLPLASQVGCQAYRLLHKSAVRRCRERESGCTVQIDGMSGNTGARIIGWSTPAAFGAPDTGTTACVAVRR